MIALFWITFAAIVYSLAGYGLIWIALAAVWPRRATHPERPFAATMLIAARNEAADIGAKVRSVLDQETGAHDLQVLIVSDGSDDGTEDAALVAAAGDPRVEVLSTGGHVGKAGALNIGLGRIPPDRIVIFSDANSTLVPGAVRALLRPFADPGVGGAIGQLDIPDRGGLLDRAERLFWRYDNALKIAEDRIGGTVSAQGTLYAVRRALVRPVPADMADDLVTSLGAVDSGYRLAFAPGAVAREAVSSGAKQEMGRRIRSTERGWRGLMQFARLMNPARTGLYAWQLVSHKFARRMVAFLLPVLLILSTLLANSGPIYAAILIAQLCVYGVALLSATTSVRLPGASVATLFTLGHLAIAIAILRWSVGVRSTKWSPVREG
ncbi:glycosyltransferase [Pelagovum pacificum]|nr:glycosyltransferase [Pelagovum pacificum]